MKVDINCDMGESYGAYTLGLDEEVMAYITSANIACGYHAGDPLVMARTVSLAKDHGVSLGAHPGFPDLLGFGRRHLEADLSEIKGYIIYQVGALQAFATAQGLRVDHVKPHGALYNMAYQDETISAGIMDALSSIDRDLIYVTLAGAGSERITRMGEKIGLRVALEAFPDRAYTPEGTLVSRRRQGSVIDDPDLAAKRALMVVRDKKIVALDGEEIPMKADTLCVHGDTPGALDLVKEIRKTLKEAGVEVMPLAKLL